MYCASCGIPVTASLSFCNRCGTSLRERPETRQTGVLTALLTAITLIGICGLGIMLVGSVVLRRAADLPVDAVGIFMLFTFLIVAMTEIMLVRNVSKLIGSSQTKQQKFPVTQQPPLELHSPAASTFGEPFGSVTDNTTRTLEYARGEK